MSILSFLHSIYRPDNPFVCDCDLLWLQSWLHQRGSSVLNLPKKTTCYPPATTTMSSELNRRHLSPASPAEDQPTYSSPGEVQTRQELPPPAEIGIHPFVCSRGGPNSVKCHLSCMLISFVIVYYLGYELIVRSWTGP